MANTGFATINGIKATDCKINIPYYGNWSADISLAIATVVTNPITLVISNLTMTGYIYRDSMYSGYRKIRLIGGYGGWRTMVAAKPYQNPSGIKASMVLKDVAATVGESVNVITDSTIGNFFIRENAPAQRVLRQLANPVWWIANSGVTQIGARTTGRITSVYDLIGWEGAYGKATIATESVADWMPGKTFSNVQLSVTQEISLTSITADNAGKCRVDVLTN